MLRNDFILKIRRKGTKGSSGTDRITGKIPAFPSGESKSRDESAGNMNQPGELLKLVVGDGSPVARSKLTSSRSCLALNEIKALDHEVIFKSMSSKDLSSSYSTVRRDSGTESGFVESETESEFENARNSPISFSSLPPLEQRRQKRIQELVKMLENFTNATSELVQKMHKIVKEAFSNALPTRLAMKRASICKIESFLQQILNEILARKIDFKEREFSGDQSEFYIDNFASSLSTKLEGVIKTLDGVQDGTDMLIALQEDEKSDSSSKIFDDLLFLITEYFLRMQLCIRYVLYCTPRRHIDHQPLSRISNELSRINRKIWEKSLESSCEKGRAESFTIIDSTSKKKNGFNLKRRYSLDNATFKKLSSLSRGLSFGRKSNRAQKQGNVNSSNEEHSDMLERFSIQQGLDHWHSTPNKHNAQSEMNESKATKINEVKETSFDTYQIEHLKSDPKSSFETHWSSDCHPSFENQERRDMFRADRLSTHAKEDLLGKYSFFNREEAVGSRADGKVLNDKYGYPGMSTGGSECNEQQRNQMKFELHHNDHMKAGLAKIRHRPCTPSNDEKNFVSKASPSYKPHVSQIKANHVSAALYNQNSNVRGESARTSERFNCEMCNQQDISNSKGPRSTRDHSIIGNNKCSGSTRDHSGIGNNKCSNPTRDHSGISNNKCSSSTRDRPSSVNGSYVDPPVDSVLSRGCSPTILRESSAQSHSPTLLNSDESNLYIYYCEDEPIGHPVHPEMENNSETNRIPRAKEKPKVKEKPKRKEFPEAKATPGMHKKAAAKIEMQTKGELEVKGKTEENLKSEIGEKQESVPKVEVSNLAPKEDFLAVPNISPDCYTSDEDSRLDRFLGEMYPDIQEIPPRGGSSELLISSASSSQGQNAKRRGSNIRGSGKITHFARNSTPFPSRINDFPAFENSSKGIRVAVARAKKKFRDFTSPKVLRKKERNLNAFENVNSFGEKEVHGGCEDYVSGASFIGQNGHQGFSADESGRTSNPNASPVLNYSPIRRDVALLGKSEEERDCESCWAASRDVVDEKNASCVTRKLSTSSSLGSDLSISSDFHTTVSKLLRSNSMQSDSQITIGQSKFYYQVESGKSPVKILVGNAEGSENTPPSTSASTSDLKKEKLHASDNVDETVLSGRISVTNGREVAFDQAGKSKTKSGPIRISRSEPLLKNNQSPARFLSNTSFDSQENLQKFHRIPQSRILSWRHNFDTLLTDKDGIKVFAEFLKSEYSEENILFWLACENFKSLRSTNIGKSAQKIYKTFIETFSTCEINLDHQTRISIKEGLLEPSKDMFDTAQLRIRQLMAQDSYHRFIKSAIYQSLLRA